jgi:hypothetical protein
LSDELTRHEGRQTFQMLMRPFDKTVRSQTPSAKEGVRYPAGQRRLFLDAVHLSAEEAKVKYNSLEISNDH